MGIILAEESEYYISFNSVNFNSDTPYYSENINITNFYKDTPETYYFIVTE
ncbi:hypothetical protein JCM19300_2754 [Algibacter lectus]|uniref:Uncharacterized protein n=2 Tax=Algibacter lectus TaxID=221126 RepID=A0A090WTD3_9FLAO|nr:hypothetical protein JCM19300_2754 [Algibacter lectus]GAL80281.1 hypothetical protein JCM19274_571 [Algibacter lectus]